MLNTVLYVLPIVGKTSMGIMLVRVWYSLGYLKEGQENGKLKLEKMEAEKREETIEKTIYIFVPHQPKRCRGFIRDCRNKSPNNYLFHKLDLE